MARYAPLTYDSALVGRPPAKPANHSVFRRFYDALIQARMRQAEREVARYVAMRGKFTDTVEREIERRLAGHPSTTRTAS
jgi:hypothetical protein